MVHKTFCVLYIRSIKAKKKKKRRGSGAGTNSAATVQVNHKAGQLLSAGK